MAIVPDLSGTRPGRSGNIPLFDPRNRSHKERVSNQDDSYKSQRIVTTAIGNQVLATANLTRNAILFMIPDGAETVYISTLTMTGQTGIPVIAGVGVELKGKVAESAFYGWSASGSVSLSIFEG